MSSTRRTTRVAALQMNSGPEVDANLVQAEGLIEQAVERGARFVVLPENFSFMGHSDTERLAVAEAEGDGPAQAFLRAQARRHGIWLVGGTLPLKVPDDQRAAASCLVADPDGEIVARYDKIHLFDVVLPESGESYRESAGIAPGSEPMSFDAPFGRVGLSVCYDLRFPELYRLLAEHSAVMFTVPSAFTAATGEAHWEALTRARAIENLCYVVAPGQEGRHASGRETWGDTLIADPWGRVLDRCPAGPGVAIADVDTERQAELRRRFPVMEHRRLRAGGAEPVGSGGLGGARRGC